MSKKTNKQQEYITVKEASLLCGVSTKTIRRMIARGNVGTQGTAQDRNLKVSRDGILQAHKGQDKGQTRDTTEDTQGTHKQTGDTRDKQENSEVVRVLQDRIKDKDAVIRDKTRDIESKDKQINNLIRQQEQSNILLAQSQKTLLAIGESKGQNRGQDKGHRKGQHKQTLFEIGIALSVILLFAIVFVGAVLLYRG